MEIITRRVHLETDGFTHIMDISPQARDVLRESRLNDGQLTVFVPGSTGGITTLEYEPGLLEDLPEFLEKIIPMNRSYHHDRTWHDGNGYAHLRSALIKPSLTIPFSDGKLMLGTWQQIVFIDFDNRKRHRELVFQCMGKKKAD